MCAKRVNHFSLLAQQFPSGRNGLAKNKTVGKLSITLFHANLAVSKDIYIYYEPNEM